MIMEKYYSLSNGKIIDTINDIFVIIENSFLYYFDSIKITYRSKWISLEPYSSIVILIQTARKYLS